MPPAAKTPSIFSLSTRFFGQPRLTNATERMESSEAVIEGSILGSSAQDAKCASMVRHSP